MPPPSKHKKSQLHTDIYNLTSVAKVITSPLTSPAPKSESTISLQCQHYYDLLANKGLSLNSRAQVVHIFHNVDAHKEFLSF